VLKEVNLMERSTEPYTVASAALRHYALSRGIPDAHLWLNAERYADVILAALYRRGMID